MALRTIILTALIALLNPSCSDECPCTRFAGWDYSHLVHVKKDLRNAQSGYRTAFNNLVSDAEKALSAGPYSVAFKDIIPPGGTKNDYMSQGPYWWPDTTKPDGLPYIRRDGIRNPQSGIDRNQLGNLINATRNLSLAWYFTDEQRYADRAAYLLRVWFIEPETRMNPHLEFGQAIPGITIGRGIGIIDVRGMYTLTDAITLLRDSKSLSEEDNEKINSWFADFFTWLTTSKLGKDEDDYFNNHAVAYDVLVSSIARFLGDNDYAVKKISELPSRRIDPMIEADGRQPEELIRTNAFGYSVSNLRNFFDAGQIGLNVGVNIFDYKNPKGGSLRGALDFLIGYIGREDEWKWQQIGGWQSTENSLGLLVRSAARFYSSPEYRKIWDDMFAEKMKGDWTLLVTPE